MDEAHLFMPDSQYMENQTELRPKMRALALEWLIDVHHKFKLLPETLFLTVNYMDRFLSTNNISKKDL